MKQASQITDELSLRVLPRQRMRRRLRRFLVVALAAQAGATIAALVALQTVWKGDDRPDHSPSVAALALDLLNRQRTGRITSVSKEMLDRVADAPSIEFACVIDDADRVLLTGGDSGPDLGAYGLDPAREVPVNTQTLVAAIPSKRLRIYESRLPERFGVRQSVLIGVRDLGSDRAVLDGAAAAGIGMLVTALIALPLVWCRIGGWSQGLHRLHTSIRRLALNAPLAPLPVTGDDEIAYLSLAFNDMAGKLTASRRSLLTANQTLEERVRERTDELREVNCVLERQNVKLEELTETALRFTDDVAHELRTPLTVVMEFASIIEDGIGGSITDQQREYLRFISDASGELARLVDDFLDSSKLRSGTLRVDRQELDIDRTLDAIWPMLELRATRAHIALRRTVAAGLPRVFADREKLGRTIINLTINAIKFSRAGSTVTIGAALDDELGVRISVTDQGPGLSPEEVHSVFERFRQTASGKVARTKGFGLGLSIVQGLVSLNLGTIGVESTPGVGSTFSFTVPSYEPAVIVDMFLAGVTERATAARVGVMLLECGDGGGSASDLIARLAPLLHPYDIQLPTNGAVLLFGETSDIDRWSDRLRREYAETDDLRADTTPVSLRVISAAIHGVDEVKERLLMHFDIVEASRAA